MTSSIPDKAKVNTKHDVETLLRRLIDERISLLPSGFIFQQDNAPAHKSKVGSRVKTRLPSTVVNLLAKINGCTKLAQR